MAPTIRPTIRLRARKPLDFAGLKHEDTKKQHSEAVWQFNAGSNPDLHNRKKTSSNHLFVVSSPLQPRVGFL